MIPLTVNPTANRYRMIVVRYQTPGKIKSVNQGAVF